MAREDTAPSFFPTEASFPFIDFLRPNQLFPLKNSGGGPSLQKARSDCSPSLPKRDFWKLETFNSITWRIPFRPCTEGQQDQVDISVGVFPVEDVMSSFQKKNAICTMRKDIVSTFALFLCIALSSRQIQNTWSAWKLEKQGFSAQKTSFFEYGSFFFFLKTLHSHNGCLPMHWGPWGYSVLLGLTLEAKTRLGVLALTRSVVIVFTRTRFYALERFDILFFKQLLKSWRRGQNQLVLTVYDDQDSFMFR